MNQNLKRPGLGNWPSNQEYKKTINSSRYQFRTLYFAGYIFFNKGRILRNESEYSAASDKEFTTKNYRELTNVNWENIMPKDKVNRLIIDFAKDLNLQIYRAPLIGQTELRLGQIQSAIQLYQLEKKQWPKKIEELNTYLSSIPIDPFSEKPFLWAMDAAGKPTAYSVGPDFKDDAAKITYDPTNGMVSVGDIIP